MIYKLGGRFCMHALTEMALLWVIAGSVILIIVLELEEFHIGFMFLHLFFLGIQLMFIVRIGVMLITIKRDIPLQTFYRTIQEGEIVLEWLEENYPEIDKKFEKNISFYRAVYIDNLYYDIAKELNIDLDSSYHKTKFFRAYRFIKILNTRDNKLKLSLYSL